MTAEQPQDAVARSFAERFAEWSIELPQRSAGDRGSISRSGWTINYRYLVDQGEEYLYVFESHRMTNDVLCRIHENGEVEHVSACRVFYRADDAAAEQEYFEANRRFYEQVKALDLFEVASAEAAEPDSRRE